MSEAVKVRIQNLINKMEEIKQDALVIGSEANRNYLSGFTGSNALLYLTKSRKVIITDFRYMEQAAFQCEGFEVVNQGTFTLIQKAMELAKNDSIKYIGFESEHMTYSNFMELNVYSSFQFLPTKGIVEELREIKDEEELVKLRKAEQIGDLAFSQIISYITEGYKKGITENDIALELERIMRKNGAAKTSFSTIVAAGPKSSLPHAVPGAVSLKEGDFLVMDFGCVYQGYCSDMTRTLVIGEPTDQHKRIYNTVLNAQMEALRMIKPGIEGKIIDNVARESIAKAGYGSCFGHGLGHSVGLEIHESPRFSPKETKKIKKGMVLTVEPGIYIPGFGGVRIEDVVIITDDGIENITHSPKDLIVIK